MGVGWLRLWPTVANSIFRGHGHAETELLGEGTEGSYLSTSGGTTNHTPPRLHIGASINDDRAEGGAV